MTGTEDKKRLPAAAKVNLALLAILGAALAFHLWPEWTADPDLSHGFVMPAACILLLVLARRPEASGVLRSGAAAALSATLGVAALACLWGAGLLAASLDWTSPIVDFALSCSFALLGCAGLAAFADRRSPWIAFGWPSLAAALLWPLASPLPPGTYTRLTLGLQLWVSSGVMHALGLLGIAARREGNIIELAHGTVGIEEACSGVRSLVACIFAGVVFSAALKFRPWARLLLIALAAPLALAMNFMRSLALTLLVNGGVRVEGAWHDATGYAVLAATAGLLLLLALALERASKEGAPATPPAPPAAAAAARAPASQRVLAAVLACAVATLVFFTANTRPARPAGPAPDLMAILPSSAPGWQVQTPADLYRFAGTLRTDHLAQRTYLRPGPNGTEQVTLYVAYWPPGQASVGLVASHTPDACWPGAGWVQEDVPDPRATLETGGRRLPPAQHRLFSNAGYPQQVWFWQLYGGRPIEVASARSVGALMRIALRFGFRQGGEHLFVRVSGNRPWADLSREPFLVDFFSRLSPLGLY